jgi:hypothetical protein
VAVKCLAAFEIILILFTYPLWLGASAFPSVPLLMEVPVIASRVASIGLLMSCTVVVVVPVQSRTRLLTYSAFVALVCGGLLVFANQHRLQSWHCLTMLSFAWLLMVPRNMLPGVMRQTVAAVYVCSALSRISMTPDEGISGIIVRQLLVFVGQPGWQMTPEVISRFSTLMTLGEFLVGLLLVFPATSRWGAIGSLVLHCSLLLALGPFGLNHHAGVLLWNMCFLCLIPILFLWPPQGQNEEARSSVFVRTLVAMIWLFPLSGLLGFADNWPSWQLYSPRPENWILQVHVTDRGLMPTEVQSVIAEPTPLSEWCTIKLDRWSLEQTRSPMYPEDRFQREVIRILLAKCPDDLKFRIEISEPEFPFWWNRRNREITSREELN